jgi:hypothetical protein
MKPITAALKVANWLFRGSILIFLLLFYYEKIIVVNFKNFNDVLVFVYLLSAILLFIGGFLSKPTLTIISGVLLFLCTLYFMVLDFPADISSKRQIMAFLIYTWPAGVGLYFAGSGN